MSGPEFVGQQTVFVDHEAVLSALTPHQVLQTQQLAFVEHQRGRAIQSQHHAMQGANLLFSHAAAIPGVLGAAFKTGVQIPGNRSRGLPAVQASVTLHDETNGVVVAHLDGAAVTTLRTAGGIVAATKAATSGRGILSVGLLGSGPQARCAAMLARATMQAPVTMWSPQLAMHPEPPNDVTIAKDAEELCRGSDVIICCTSSATPVLFADWLRPDAVIGTIGSHGPELSEVGDDVTSGAESVYVDDSDSRTRVGPVRCGLASGALDAVRIKTISSLFTPGSKQPSSGIQLIHSRGVGLQDAFLAWAVYLGPEILAQRLDSMSR